MGRMSEILRNIKIYVFCRASTRMKTHHFNALEESDF